MSIVNMNERQLTPNSANNSLRGNLSPTNASSVSDDTMSIADSCFSCAESRHVTVIADPWAKLPGGRVALETMQIPCAHNNWNILRVKKAVAVLACREACMCNWHMQLPLAAECKRFKETNQCALGASCPLLHVHKFKKTNMSPNARAHRANAERDPVLHRAAIDVMSCEKNRAAGALENESLLMELIGARREELLHASPKSTPNNLTPNTPPGGLAGGFPDDVVQNSSFGEEVREHLTAPSQPPSTIGTYSWDPYALQLVVQPTEASSAPHRRR